MYLDSKASSQLPHADRSTSAIQIAVALSREGPTSRNRTHQPKCLTAILLLGHEMIIRGKDTSYMEYRRQGNQRHVRLVIGEALLPSPGIAVNGVLPALDLTTELDEFLPAFRGCGRSRKIASIATGNFRQFISTKELFYAMLGWAESALVPRKERITKSKPEVSRACRTHASCWIIEIQTPAASENSPIPTEAETKVTHRTAAARPQPYRAYPIQVLLAVAS
ncbi:hypothetical protein DFH09DRAFT_1081743 [Mycena vulgaris]|nr:hypothetical protein DFH09DRAFT_1081743 [Mycena vulgaris]